jgi:hypothetical protein
MKKQSERIEPNRSDEMSQARHQETKQSRAVTGAGETSRGHHKSDSDGDGFEDIGGTGLDMDEQRFQGGTNGKVE